MDRLELINTRMEKGYGTVDYTVYLEPYVDYREPGESEFADWCVKNGRSFDEWVMRLIDATMYNNGMYRVGSREEFESTAEAIYDWYVN